MVSVWAGLAFVGIAFVVGCLAGMMILAVMTRGRTSDLEGVVWALYHASQVAEDVPGIAEARRCVWEVLRGS